MRHQLSITKEEVNRKLLHLAALLMPVGIFYLRPPWFQGLPQYTAIVFLLVLFLSSAIVETLRFQIPVVQKIFRRIFGCMLRQDEKAGITGSTYIICASLICSIVFYSQPHISFMSLSIFILADAAAALIGISMGRIKIGCKSLEGSMACLFLCIFMFYLVFPAVPGLLDVWNKEIPTPLIFITSLCITLLELVPMKITHHFKINDNLFVPVITGFVMIWLYPIFAG